MLGWSIGRPAERPGPTLEVPWPLVDPVSLFRSSRPGHSSPEQCSSSPPPPARSSPPRTTGTTERRWCSSRPTACGRTSSRSTPRAGSHAGDERAPAQGRLGHRRRPADPGAAEHRRRLVHPRDGRLAGRHRLDEQHVPHQRQPFGNRTAAFDPGVLQAESIAQSAERGGKKVAQIEWAGGRSAPTQGPTVDFRALLLRPRSGDELHRSPTDDESFTRRWAAVRLARAASPATPRSRKRLPRRPPAGSTCRRATARRVLVACPHRSPASTCPALDVYLYDTTDDGRVNYDRALFARSKDGSAAVADLRQGQTADVKVTISGGTLDGKTGAFLLKVEKLSTNLSQVRLFHTSVTRAIASWPTWPGEPGFTGTFEDYVAATFPSSQAGDFAVLEAGIVSEDTYTEQGLYWETFAQPLARYIIDKYQPDLVLAGYPVTDEVPAPVPRARQQEAAQRPGQPGLRRRPGERHAGRPGGAARGLHPARVPGRRYHAVAHPKGRERQRDHLRRLGPRLRAAVRGHRRQQGPRRPQTALEAADLQLPTGDRRGDR